MFDFDIVLIADRVYKDETEIDIDDTNLEQIGNSYFFYLYNGLRKLSNNVHHYNSLPEFINNISKHTNDLVFTIYGGRDSRNRMALVPSICEAYGIRFVGADTYNRVVFQDKEISKEIAKKLGFKVPKSKVFSDVNYLSERLHTINLDFPVVVKPLMEGSSIGINQNSLCYDITSASKQLAFCLERFHQPAMVEEYVYGRELMACTIGDFREIKLCEIIEVYSSGDENFFENKLYSNDLKHTNALDLHNRVITSEVDTKVLKTIQNAFQSFGKMDFMRIDGRLKNGEFYLLEFTPDAFIGPACSFECAYQAAGKPYELLLADIIQTALDYYRTPNSTRK